MRGAAPSVVCPRCGHASPPSGAGRFMTCAKCGMSIDSAADERQEPVRRTRAESEPEVVVDPALPPKRGLSPLQIVIALAVIFGIATVIVMVPSGDEVRERAERVEAERRRRAAGEQLDPLIREIYPNYASMEYASCRNLALALLVPCRTPAVQLGVGQAPTLDELQTLGNALLRGQDEIRDKSDPGRTRSSAAGDAKLDDKCASVLQQLTRAQLAANCR